MQLTKYEPSLPEGEIEFGPGPKKFIEAGFIRQASLNILGKSAVQGNSQFEENSPVLRFCKFILSVNNSETTVFGGMTPDILDQLVSELKETVFLEFTVDHLSMLTELADGLMIASYILKTPGVMPVAESDITTSIVAANKLLRNI